MSRQMTFAKPFLTGSEADAELVQRKSMLIFGEICKSIREWSLLEMRTVLGNSARASRSQQRS